METYRYRSLAAEILKKSIQSLLIRFPKAKVICMGDFNDTPTDDSLVKILEAKLSDNPQLKGEMINLSSGWMSNEIQTIKSKFSWEVFDQFMVSDYFLEKNKCFEYRNAEIFKAAFLLEPDVSFGGFKPKRTYVGFRYQEGFSDHLPVLLRLQLLDH
jgi:endonuclease/exonuclease/phosphatase family metal-dependent hydrolase